ncbi:MAG: hypothetical protein R2788_07430 [Saprospiraceae bacterium]
MPATDRSGICWCYRPFVTAGKVVGGINLAVSRKLSIGPSMFIDTDGYALVGSEVQSSPLVLCSG